MGSQSVTDFSAAKQKRIRALIEDYSPSSPKAGERASEIGTAAVGALGKGPTNEFLQALSSPSVETAIDLIMSLAGEMKESTDTDIKQVYEKYDVDTKTQQPFSKVSASLIKTLSDSLSTSQKDTDSAFAAKDAIPKTIIDVVSRAFPHTKEPVEIDRKKLAQAFKKVGHEEIATVFMQNVASALINLVLDATRGSMTPARTARLKQKVREEFVPEFIERLKRGE